MTSSSTSEGGHESHTIFDSSIIIIFALFMVYMAFEAFKEKHHLKFGHQASLVTLLGLGISAFSFYVLKTKEFS